MTTLLDPLPTRSRYRSPITGGIRAARGAAWRCANDSRWIIISLGITVSVAGIIAMRWLTFESDPLRYFPQDSKVYRDFTALDTKLTGMLPFQIEMDRRVEAASMLAQTPGVRKVIDITRFVETEGSVYWCLADNDALPLLQEAQIRWHEWARSHGAALHWRGVAGQLAFIGVIIRNTAVIALPLMVAVAGLAIALATCRWRDGMLSLWVNLVPVLALIVLASASRWPLGLPAMMIGAVVTGIAVDDTLHLMVARRDTLSLKRAFTQCWKPCVGSSLIAAACLMLFVLSPFQPVAQFGLLLGLSIAVAGLADFLLLPALLGIADPRRTRLAPPSTR